MAANQIALSARLELLLPRLWGFVNEQCVARENEYFQNCKDTHGNWTLPAVMEQLKAEAKASRLWNLFLPSDFVYEGVSGFSHEEIAIMAEIVGRSFIAAEACNCSAPDAANMEVLIKFGTPAHKDTYLQPLLTGEAHSAFLLSEPDVASSDPLNISTSIERITNPASGAVHYRINGRKWWATGALHPKCKFALVVGRMVNPEFDSQPAEARLTVLVVPLSTPGVHVTRSLSVFGYDDAPHGHAEVQFADVDVPEESVILGEGRGMEVVRTRGAASRIRNCMRAIGLAERALQAMVERADSREASGSKLREHGMVAHAIAQSRASINQARLLVLDCARRLDQHGADACRQELALLQIAVPKMACEVVDRAIQVHGGLGLCQDSFLARAYAAMRAMRIYGGPEEALVHTIASIERTVAPDLEAMIKRCGARASSMDMEKYAAPYHRPPHIPGPISTSPTSIAANRPRSPRSPSSVVSGYPALTPQHTSLMARYLTPEMYAKLSQLRTSYGTTLDDIIQIGVESPELRIGVVAHDPECYTVFHELLDPVIATFHNTQVHLRANEVPPNHELSGLTPHAFAAVDKVLQCPLVNRVRIEVARNVDGFPFEPTITRVQRREVESKIVAALAALPPQLQGKYTPVTSISTEQLRSFDCSRLLTEFTKDFVNSSYHLLRDWPDGRGVWSSHYPDLVAWVNTEDHIRMVVACDGHSCQESLGILIKTHDALAKVLEEHGYEFAKNAPLGYLTTSTSFVGTGVRFSAIIRLERFGRIPRRLAEVCRWLGLGYKPLDHEHAHDASEEPPAPNCVVVRPLLLHPDRVPTASQWEIFNKASLGSSLSEILTIVGEGLKTLIEIEERLQNEPSANPNEVIQGALGGEYHLYGPVQHTQPEKIRARL